LNVNKSAKKRLKIFGAIVTIVLLIAGLFAFSIKLLVDNFVHGYDAPMAAARKYMDSLTEKDIQIWVERTRKYLDESSKGEANIYLKDVPPELRQLGILGIHKDTNWVSYVWLGGLEHTSLEVERMTDGSFRFTAEYNDESNRVIWPKTPEPKNSQTNSPSQLSR
jgi:hypothetical protein